MLAVVGSGGSGGVRAGYGTGWVYRVGVQEGYTGYYPAPREDSPMTAERAPEGLQGLEWVVIGLGRVSWVFGGGDGHIPTLRARSVPPVGPPWE